MGSILDNVDMRELGERLKAARSKARLSQSEVADKLGFARTTLVAIEKGQRQLKPAEFRQLCELYGASASSLLRPEAVCADILPRFRSLSSAENSPAAEAAELLMTLAAAEVELENMLGHRGPVQNFPAERALLPGDIREQAEDAAAELRHKLGIGLSPIHDIVSLLEVELGVRVFVRPLHSSISGLFAYDDRLGACMLLNQKHPRERRALTGAHELGHLISARSEPEVLEIGASVNSSREERFANYFSFAFSMPAPLVRRRFHEIYQQAGRFSPRSLILLAHALHVSEEAMCRRLEDLKLVPNGAWESLKDRGFSGDLARQVIGDRSEPESVRMPPRLWFLAAEAYRRELVTEGQLAEMLKLDRLEVRELIDTLDSDGSFDGELLPADE